MASTVTPCKSNGAHASLICPQNVLQDTVQIVQGTSHIQEQEQAPLMCLADRCTTGDGQTSFKPPPLESAYFNPADTKVTYNSSICFAF
jgi:hypothetical protein